MKLATISAAVTNGNRSVGMLSLIGSTREDYVGAAAQAPPPPFLASSLRPDERRGHGDDPPRVGARPAERERPAFGELPLPRLVASHDRGRVAILEITPADDLDLDRHRRRLGVGVKAGNSDPFYARTANNEPCAAARIAGMKQLACGVAIRELE